MPRAVPPKRAAKPAKAAKRAKAAKPATAAKSTRGDGYALRARILRNAADVFGKLGAADTTVEHILVASDVSRRTFYRFFKSKEDVLDALHEIGCDILIAAAGQASTLPGDPIDRLSRAIEAYVEYHVTVGTNVMHVVQGESMRPGSRLEPRRRAFFDTMVELFEREMNTATGLHVDPMLLRSLLIALEGVSLMLRAEAQTNGFELARAKRVMLRMVMAAVAAPEGNGVPPLPLVEPPQPNAKPKRRSKRSPT